MGMGDLGKRLDVADIAGGVADGLGEYRAGVLVDQSLDRVRLIALGEAAGDALPRKDVGQQRVRGAVELRHGNDVAAVIGDVDEGEVQRGLSGRNRERADAALELADALFENCAGRIGDAAVAKAFGLQIEEGRAVVGAVEGVGGGLVDRHRDCVRGGLYFIAGVNSDRFVPHRAPPQSAGRTYSDVRSPSSWC